MPPFVALQGWYIVTYALGIYHLNLFIAFLTPKIDPAMGDDYGEPVVAILCCSVMFESFKLLPLSAHLTSPNRWRFRFDEILAAKLIGGSLN